MLSRKSKDKSIKEGVVGKYVKKDTPPEIPGKPNLKNYQIFAFVKFYILLYASDQRVDH